MKEVVIVDCIRTPMGRSKAGVFRNVRAETLSAHLMEQILKRNPALDPKDIEDLFKIGFSRKPVLERIKNAASDPTFLMADVAPVTHFETFNLNPQQFEKLIHRFFAKACLNLDVIDDSGKRFTPREWFVVPLPVIEEAIKLLISGDIVNYQYDSSSKSIELKSKNKQNSKRWNS